MFHSFHPLQNIGLTALLTAVLLAVAEPARGQLLDDREITILSPADIDKKRDALTRFIWGKRGVPDGSLPVVEKNDKSPVRDLDNLQRVDTLTIRMEADQKSYAHHFIPKRKNNRLVILHHGHGPTFDDPTGLTDRGYGLQRTINGLLTNGYSVLAVYMPHIVKFKTNLDVNDVGKTSHDAMFATIKVKSGSVMKFFLEPVATSLHYLRTRSEADDFPAYRDYSMIGLSGGGWTTTVYAAIDPRIQFSFPVAGTIPLHLRTTGSIGDTEQTLAPFYRLAGYPDLYVLGSYGAGRKQVQILNRRDDCCFGERQHDARKSGQSYDEAMRAYEARTRTALFNLSPKTPHGHFRLEIDEAAPAHTISWNAVLDTILAELNGGRKCIGATSTEAFVRGMNGNLWRNGPKGWEDTKLPMVGVPAAVKGGVNAIDVLYRGPRNELLHAYPDGGTWKKQVLKGVIICDPAAISTKAGTIDIVAFGGNYKPYHWHLTRTGVTPFAEVKTSALGVGPPSLVSRGPGQLDLFYRGLDGGLHHVRNEGKEWVPKALGGQMLDFPSAVAAPDGSLRVYLRGQSDALLEVARAKDGKWEWTSISKATGQLIAGSPSASVDGDTVRVHARTPAGTLSAFGRSKTWAVKVHEGSITGSPTSTPGGAFARDAKGELGFHDGAMWSRLGGNFD